MLFLGLLIAPGRSLAVQQILFDDFEAGNTDKWQQDGSRDRCQAVIAAVDGQVGPYAGLRFLSCNSNGTVEWNDPAVFETLFLPTLNYGSELFVRTKLRIDADFSLESDIGSPKKLLRIFNWDGEQSHYMDIFESTYQSSGGLSNEIIGWGQQMPTYWGGATGDYTLGSATTSWREVEYYFNPVSGMVKVWHDGVLVQNVSGLTTNSSRWEPFYITSNWSDTHDAANHIYFDNLEIFSDIGNGGVLGSMSNGDIRLSESLDAVPPLGPTGLVVM